MTPQVKQRIEQIRRGEVPEGYKRTKAGVVPIEWEEVRIGDVLTQRKTLQCVSKDAPLLSFTIEEGVIDPADKKSNKRDFLIKDMATKKFALTEVGDIIYNPANLKFGAIHRNNLRRGVVSPIYGIFHGEQDSVFMGYLLHNQRFIDYAKVYTEGTVEKLKTLKADTFLKLKITLPSLSEQKKIAEILSEQDKLIVLAEKLMEEKKLQLKALMQQLLIGEERLGISREKWTTKTLGSICKIVKGEQLNKNVLLSDGDYYVLNGGVNPSGYSEKWNTVENTISISEGGSTCGFVTYNSEKFWSGGHNYTLQSIQPHINKMYLYYFLKSNEASVMRLRVGSGLPNIQKGSLEHFKVFYPSFEIQLRIAQFLTSMEKEIKLLQKELEQEKQKKKALMQLLLTGIVRVDI